MTRAVVDVVCPTVVVLEIETGEPMTCSGFDDAVSAWIDLVSFATRETCAITSFHLVHVDPDVRPVPIPVRQEDGTITMTVETREFERVVTMRAWWSKVPDEPAARGVNPYEFAFMVGDRPLAEWYAAWMTLRSRARNALDVLLSLTYGKNTFLQSDLLTAALAAETLHRGLFPDCLAMLPKDFEKMIASAVQGMDEQDAERIRRSIRNEPSYADRLRDLTRIPGEAAIKLAVPDVDRWAQQLSAARNGLAHGLRGAELEVQRMHDLMKRTRLLLERWSWRR